MQIDYSPIVALNRTYALSKANGKEIAILEAEKLKLTDNHLYYSLLGNLYTHIDDNKAIENYEKALSLISSQADKAVILQKLFQINKK